MKNCRKWGQVIRIPMAKDVRKTKLLGDIFPGISQSPQWTRVCYGFSGRLSAASSNLVLFFAVAPVVHKIQLGAVID